MEGSGKLERWEEEPDELNVSMALRSDPFPASGSTKEERQTEGNFSDTEDVELPRRAAGQMTGDALVVPQEPIHLDAIHKPTPEKAIKENPTAKKTREFVEAIKKDGAWARTLTSVKITVHGNRFFTKETLRDFVHHVLTKVNNRPRFLNISSKKVTLDDIREMIEVVFTPVDDPEIAIEGSTTRIYSKNTSPSLIKLSNCLSDACEGLPGVEVEYHDVFGELVDEEDEDNRRRFRTLNLMSYFLYEEHARALGCRILASFTVSQIGCPGRALHIRWYDELASDGKTRVSYIHFDHSVRAASRPCVKFSDKPPVVLDVSVDEDDEMRTWRSGVTDFIEFLAESYKP